MGWVLVGAEDFNMDVEQVLRASQAHLPSLRHAWALPAALRSALASPTSR